MNWFRFEINFEIKKVWKLLKQFNWIYLRIIEVPLYNLQYIQVPGNFHLSTHSAAEQPENPDLRHVIHSITFGDDLSVRSKLFNFVVIMCVTLVIYLQLSVLGNRNNRKFQPTRGQGYFSNSTTQHSRVHSEGINNDLGIHSSHKFSCLLLE